MRGKNLIVVSSLMIVIVGVSYLAWEAFDKAYDSDVITPSVGYPVEAADTSITESATAAATESATAVTVSVTGKASVRNAPTTIGSTVFDQLNVGTNLVGRWVFSTVDPSQKWFEFNLNGQKAYVWGGNLTDQIPESDTTAVSDISSSNSSEEQTPELEVSAAEDPFPNTTIAQPRCVPVTTSELGAVLEHNKNGIACLRNGDLVSPACQSFKEGITPIEDLVVLKQAQLSVMCFTEISLQYSRQIELTLSIYKEFSRVSRP